MLAGLVLVAATLYWAQKILIPLVLAVLLTFVLSPLVAVLQRRGLPRVPSAHAAVLLALLVLGGVGSGLTLQVKRLVGELPQYKENIERKVAGVRGLGDGAWVQNLRDTFQVITGGAGPEGLAGEAATPRTVPVRVESSALSEFGGLLGPTAESLAAAGLVVVLVIFMLIQREDLRNRVVRLVPHGRLLATTRALTEAAERLSRFLLMQLAVNAAYGLVVGIGLALFGVPYALVWGILTAFLRYLPYVGTFLAMAFLTLFSVAVFPGWTSPLMVLGFLAAVELLAANVVEPVLFGHSTGVSPLALLIAVAFWTWLWGPVGLVLSTPLTVCMLVLGRYVPNLEFLGVLLGDEPSLAPEINFYQRLLARDQDEATALVEEFVRAHPPEVVYDRVLVPALSLAKGDRESDELTPDAEQFVYRATRDILDELAAAPPPDTLAGDETAPPEAAPALLAKALVLGCPARDEGDELTLDMLAQLLGPCDCRFEVIPAGTPVGELASRVKRDRPAVLCVAALPPGGLAQTHLLCKRLRAQFPRLKILVGLWGVTENREGLAERLRSAGADQVVGDLVEARNAVGVWLQAASTFQGMKAPA
jgi:predicted PurR-regulated permease PerM